MVIMINQFHIVKRSKWPFQCQCEFSSSGRNWGMIYGHDRRSSRYTVALQCRMGRRGGGGLRYGKRRQRPNPTYWAGRGREFSFQVVIFLLFPTEFHEAFFFPFLSTHFRISKPILDRIVQPAPFALPRLFFFLNSLFFSFSFSFPSPFRSSTLVSFAKNSLVATKRESESASASTSTTRCSRSRFRQ